MLAHQRLWGVPAKNAEILGFAEEDTFQDVFGVPGRLALHVAVRVPESGKYRLSAALKDETGNATNQDQTYDLPAGTNRVDLRAGPPRKIDGTLKIQNVRLEKIDGKTANVVAQRDFLGIIGPYTMVEKESESRRKARAMLHVPVRKRFPDRASPLTSHTLTGKIENITGEPNAAGKFEVLRFRVEVPRVTGRCSWFASLKVGDQFVGAAITEVDAATAPESIVFEFPGNSISWDGTDGDVRLDNIIVAHQGPGGWVHRFDQFPGFPIPGLRLAMVEGSVAISVRFTGKNHVEFIDSNHNGKYEAVKVAIGFESNRACKVRPTYKDSNGSSYQAGTADYDPRAGKPQVVFYIGFDNPWQSGDHFLQDFEVECKDARGEFVRAHFDKSYRVSLGNFSSEQFERAFELSFANKEAISEDGWLVYHVNCTPHLMLDLPIEFAVGQYMPTTKMSVDPPRGKCKANATTLRFKPVPDTPPITYPISVHASNPTGTLDALANTTWVKASVPEVLGVLPNAGSGKLAAFRMHGDDLSTRIAKMELLINDREDIAHACRVTLVRFAVSLTGDSGLTQQESKNPNHTPLENSQCVVGKYYDEFSSVPIRFKPAFSGLKNIYVRAWNDVGANSGWSRQGTWEVSQNEAPVPVSVSPYLGVADHQTFTFTFADANGAGDLNDLEMLVAFAPSDERQCHWTINRSTGRVSLLNDATGSLTLGGAGRLAGSQCSVGNVRILEEAGRMLRVSADVNFAPGFRGRRNVFLKAADKGKLESRWLWAGSWYVP